MVFSLAEMHPSPAREWSDRNLPLRPEEISEKSRSNVWWKCSAWTGMEKYQWGKESRGTLITSTCLLCETNIRYCFT